MITELTVGDIIQLVGIAVVLIINIFQSIKMDHFKSECMDCSIEVNGFGLGSVPGRKP
jgi:hypothetical protein